MASAAGGRPDWNQVASEINKVRVEGERNGKQCRARWAEQLRPGIKKGCWTKREQEMIMYYYGIYGPKWSAMSKLMKSRTDNDIKNKYNSMIRMAKKEQQKYPNKSIATIMKEKFSTGTPFVPKMAPPSVPAVVTNTSSSDSDNSAYSYQDGAQPNQVQPLFLGDSVLPGAFEPSPVELQQPGIAPMATDDDDAFKPLPFKPNPFDDLDGFHFP